MTIYKIKTMEEFCTKDVMVWLLALAVAETAFRERVSSQSPVSLLLSGANCHAEGAAVLWVLLLGAF